jgi:hypothetical protein
MKTAAEIRAAGRQLTRDQADRITDGMARCGLAYDLLAAVIRQQHAHLYKDEGTKT